MADALTMIRQGRQLTLPESIQMIIKLSVPVIIAQLSAVVMQYIDAAMVGHLATDASAAIGLVSTTTWLLSGLTSALAVGFYVQVAHRLGAGQDHEARNIVRYGLVAVTLMSGLLGLLAALVAGDLPGWLGGASDLQGRASTYLLVYACSLPILALNYTAGGMLQSSGNMKVPSLLNILMCLLDVIFNFFLIFPSRQLELLGQPIHLIGFDLGVLGAALGTLLAELVAMILMVAYLVWHSEKLKFKSEPFILPIKLVLRKAGTISLPVALESAAMSVAYIVSTSIIAPLGTIPMAAHAFAITVETLCYMPGYGIGAAATSVVGQCVGAKQTQLAKRLAWVATTFGVVLMSITGCLMYLLAPQLLALLSPEPEVIDLGTRILRIEALAEPLYGASIVITGVYRGTGDTLVPGIMNLVSMWLVRLPLSYLLVNQFGLVGVWVAMAIELVCRGLIFIYRLVRHSIQV